MRSPLTGAALIGAALLAACASSTAPGATVRVATTVTPDAVRAGDVVTVRVAVTNETDRPQHINTSTCPDRFVVYDASGARLPDVPRTCSLGSEVRALQPGETYVLTGSWVAAVAPGAYTVRGWVTSARGGDGPPAAATVTP